MIKNTPLLLTILSIIILGQTTTPFSFFNNNKLFIDLIFNFNSYVLENLINHKLFINNESSNVIKSFQNKKNIDVLISNHYSTIDFVLIFYFINIVNRKDFIVLLKKELIYYPGLNNIIDNKNYIKLNRDWSKDETIIKTFLKKVKNGLILIFPEGTRICPETYNESITFSKKNNVTINKNLLIPKVKGLFNIISLLKKENKFGNLYDLTSVVPEIKKNFHKKDFDLFQLFFTDISESYHIFRKIDIPEFNYDYDVFKKWLYHLWNTKDFLINNYKNYKYNHIKSNINKKNVITVYTIIIIYLYLLKKYPYIVGTKLFLSYIIPVIKYIY